MIWHPPSVCPSVCPVSILTVTHQGAACDAASVHIGPTVRVTDICMCISTERGEVACVGDWSSRGVDGSG